MNHPASRRLSALSCAAALAIAGVLHSSADAAPASGPLRRLDSNPRYFTDGSGKAIYLAGSHTWANFATDQGRDKPVPFDYDGYLDFLVAHNHNFSRGWLWDVPYSDQGPNGGPFRWDPQPWLRTGPGLATDGRPKFDLSTFDQAWFDRIRARTIAARDRGIYVAIMLFQGYAWKHNRSDSDGFPFDGRNNINSVDAGPGHDAATLTTRAVTAAQEAYVRKVIDTVNDLDNVLFEIANEAHDYSTAWQYHMIDFIHAYERTKPKQHPVGMTSHFIGKVPLQELMSSPADWISPSCKSGGYIENPPVATGNKVMVVDSDHGYTWVPLKEHGPARQQAWVWKNFLRGNQLLFMDPYLARTEGKSVGRNNPGGVNPADSYFGRTPDPYWDTMRAALGRTRLYAGRINLAAALPHPDVASTGYCLAQPGVEYLVYNPGPAPDFTVTLPAGAYALEWYDPTTGKVVGTERLEVKQSPCPFSAQCSPDVVLYLRKRTN
jgi:hypothetical protein